MKRNRPSSSDLDAAGFCPGAMTRGGRNGAARARADPGEFNRMFPSPAAR